jgi:hypothetical protein
MSVQVRAGGSTATYKPGGVIYVGFPNTTNLGDTNYVCNEWTAIPASTLVNVGDEIRVETTWEADASGGSRTYRIAVGYTSCANDGTGFTGGTVIQNNSTTTASVSYLTTTRLLKTGANTQRSYSVTAVGSSMQQTASGTLSLTDTSAIKIGAALKDAGGSGGAITLRTVKVTYLPAQ